MNFTPNPANALLTDRVQQQQVHQIAPVTTSAGAPKSDNLMKNTSIPNPSFQINQQVANIQLKINEDKNQLPPTSVHHLQTAQNNTIHVMGRIPQQYIGVQTSVQTSVQTNMNRNLNIGNQSTFQQPQMSSLEQTQKGGIFQQMQQMAQQNLQFSQATPVSQCQRGSALRQQIVSQKPEAAVQQISLTNKAVAPPDQLSLNIQQGITGSVPKQISSMCVQMVSRQPPPSVSVHRAQYSTSKPLHQHPQMKTTAKLVSPGSQLQSVQKSPTASIVPETASIVPQITAIPTISNTRIVPSTPLLQNVSLAPVHNVCLAPAKTTASVSISSTPTAVMKKSVLAVFSGAEALEQSKESNQTIPSETEIVPKLSIEEKKVVPTQNNSSPTPETNNKVEKSSVLQPSVNAEKQQALVVPPKATSPSKSTMRLATVTPARQKKPPATTNNKKPVASTSAATNAQKAPVKVISSTTKVAETSKAPTNAKKAQTQAPVAVTPKSNPAPSTSSAQSNSSSASGSATSPKTKRSRVKVQPYQSPTPELALVTKLSTQTAKSNNKNGNDDKLIIFYKNEFLAVRNPDGGFYLCQAMHNVYKSSPKIRIHWLNDKNEKVSETGGQIYVLDYYDVTDFECVLTTVDLTKVESKSYELSKEEQARIESILKKAIDVEKGILPRPTVTEENPDGLDLSLYKDEAQLDKTAPNKRKLSDDSNDYDFDDDEDYEISPRKKTKVKGEPMGMRGRAAAKKPVANDESTESDEENLMEIKKKAKKQAASTNQTKPVQTKAPEPIPSTSKAATISPAGRGRKRAMKSPETEVPEKVAKPVEKVEAVKESPAPKQTPAKAKVAAKTGKKGVSEKASPVIAEKKPVADKKPVAEKKPAAKKAEVATKSTAASPKTTPEKTPTKAALKKKVTPKAKDSPADPASVVPDQQPSTSRSRNTRSKK